MFRVRRLCHGNGKSDCVAAEAPPAALAGLVPGLVSVAFGDPLEQLLHRDHSLRVYGVTFSGALDAAASGSVVPWQRRVHTCVHPRRRTSTGCPARV